MIQDTRRVARCDIMLFSLRHAA